MVFAYYLFSIHKGAYMTMNLAFIKSLLPVWFQDVQNPVSRSMEVTLQEETVSVRKSKGWRENKWLLAFKQILPLFVAVHIAALVITCLSTLLLQPDFAAKSQPFSQLWQAWNRWDTGHYLFIATQGYTVDRTVFFPLYSLLIHALLPIFNNNALITGLCISFVANLVWMVVLYQLVLEDFDKDSAQRAVLYLSVFPTAFFFLAAYTESLFLALALLSFYSARRGRWWWSGIFGLFVCLTRSTGIFLVLPFAYEYLRQDQFNLRKVRVSALAGLLLPLGLGLFALYCWQTFGDPLSFSHQEVIWNRKLMLPGWGILKSMYIIGHSTGLFSFYALRNLTDLLPDLLVLTLLILACVGPWRFQKERWGYLFYAIPLFLLFNANPNVGSGRMPLESMGRYMLEVFPAFIVLALLGGKYRWLHLLYLVTASSIAYFLLLEFLTGHWVI
jgi:Gpi18-like mannosyltransferase